MTKYADWPQWLQFVVVLPHAALGFFALWIWWPQTEEGWRKFGLVAGYLIIFWLVMTYVFKA